MIHDLTANSDFERPIWLGLNLNSIVVSMSSHERNSDLVVPMIETLNDIFLIMAIKRIYVIAVGRQLEYDLGIMENMADYARSAQKIWMNTLAAKDMAI